MKTKIFVFTVSAILLLSFSMVFAQDEESITLTTYYPAPYGEYETLSTNELKVTDGNEEAGKVLTSDDDGVGAWQDPTGIGAFVYDSGWFDIAGGTYVKTHDLGTTKVIAQVWAAKESDKSDAYLITSMNAQNKGFWVYLHHLTDTQVSLHVSNEWYYPVAGGLLTTTAGYARIILIASE